MDAQAKKAHAGLQEAYRIIEKAKHDVAVQHELVKGMSWDADDGFNGAADALSEAESEIGHALHRIEEENPEPSESAADLKWHQARVA